MKQTEWHKRWKEGTIGWHKKDPNEHLLNHAPNIIQRELTVMIPLCGKSVDLLWLAQQGLKVIGIEMVEQAITDFFRELGVTPSQVTIDGVTSYQHENITIVHSDFFSVNPDQIGQFDVIYDRAALVAIPPQQRADYIAQELLFLKQTGKLLLLTYDMPVPENQGPPYPIRQHTVSALYSKTRRITPLQEIQYTPETEPKLAQRGVEWSKVNVWLIEK